MPILKDSPGAGHFILSEANGYRSRQRVNFGPGQTIKAGQLYGVITASKLAVELAPGAADGSQTAAGIAFDDVVTTTASVEGVGIERDAEVAQVRLIWDPAVTEPQKVAALATLAGKGVIARV